MLVQIVVDRVAPTFLLEKEQAGSVHCVQKPVVKILGLQSVTLERDPTYATIHNIRAP